MQDEALAELTLILWHETDKALLVSDIDKFRDQAKWIAKSKVEEIKRFAADNHQCVMIELPEWLTKKLEYV